MDEVYEDLYLSDDSLDATVVLPTAPPDIGSFYVTLDLPKADLPQRWVPMLQKALQSWLNTTLANEFDVSCNVHKLQPLETPGCAVVMITPFSALGNILSKKSSSLTFKDLKQTAVVHFYSSADEMMNNLTAAKKTDHSAFEGALLQIPMEIKAVVDVQNFSSQVQAEVMKRFKIYSSGPHSLCMQGTLEDVNMFYAELRQVVMQKEHGESDVSLSKAPIMTQTSEKPEDLTLRVPLFQYTAACKTYGNKMRQIVEENRVRMHAEVTLSFKNQGTDIDMRSNACRDISKLLQSCIGPSHNQSRFPVEKIHPGVAALSKDAMSQSTGLDIPEHSSVSKEINCTNEALASRKIGKMSLAVCDVRGATGEDVKNNAQMPKVHDAGKSNIKKASQSTPEDQLRGAETSPFVPTEKQSPICLKGFTNKVYLPCGDAFCGKCIEKAIKGGKHCCPLCRKEIEKIEGDQPKGKMSIVNERESLPGFLGYNTIRIDYDMPSALQTEGHPNPGKPFHGLHVTAYLPDSPDGNHVVELLKRAFAHRLVFTVGTSSVTGEEDCVIWNISHKTSKYGGPLSSGYPDPDYIKQVKEELKTKGIE